MVSNNSFVDGLAARLFPAGRSQRPKAAETSAHVSPMPEDPDAYLRLEQASRLCGVHPRTIRTWEQRGLRFYRPGGRVVLLKKRDLVDYIEGRTKPTDQASATEPAHGTSL